MKTLFGMSLVLLSVGAWAQSPFGNPTTETFEQLAELTGSQAFGLFAPAPAIGLSTLVIGVPGATTPDGCFECGVAYVYTAPNGDWTNLQLTATLAQSNGQSVAGFGSAVAISGDTIAVGGYDSGSSAGAVYVFISPSGTVTENAELTTSGAPSGEFDSVSVDGGTIVAGSPLAQVGSEKELGAAYVYVEPSGGWVGMTQTAELGADDESRSCQFGVSVGISGSTIVAGAPAAKVGGLAGRGRAYIYVEPAGGWSGIQGQTTELEPSNGVKDAGFGGSVSVSGGAVAVGAGGELVGSNQSQGAVYVFSKPLSGWPKTMTQTAELTAARGTAGSEMGLSVAISDRTLIAGAPYVHGKQGVAYVFTEPSGGWQSLSEGEEIAASDGAPNNLFGLGVAVGDGVLGASAPYWPDGGLRPYGAIYVFGKSQ